MGENIYLKQLREKYTGLEKSIQGIQVRAKEANRDMTNEEYRSVVEMGEQGKVLFEQIQNLSEVELRNAQVAAMHDKVTAAITVGGKLADDPSPDGGSDGDPDDPTRSQRLGGARTQGRDPGYYTRGSQFSYVGDQYRAAHFNDERAKERLTKHANALRDTDLMRDVLGTTTGGGVGLVPPVWLAEQFAPILHRRLRVAALMRQIPWAGPYPWTIPVANTAATLSNPSAEGPSTSIETDPTYTTITVLPTTISGYSEVSRQLLEGSNPAVDAIIWGDMIGRFYDDAETNTITAIEGAAGINLVTVSGTTIDLMRGGVLDGIAAVEDNGGGDADLYFGRRARWHTYLKLTDSTGRPVVANGQMYGPQNVVGLGNAIGGFRNTIVGELESLAVATSPTVNASRGYVVNSQEVLFSISAPMQFSFEQPAGPGLIRVGVWGYMAAVANRRPKSITRIHYSAN